MSVEMYVRMCVGSVCDGKREREGGREGCV